jgi:beta-mannosidase
LYRYKIKLIREGKTHHQAEGRFAFREVRLVEEPIDSERMSFYFEINGEPIFCKGGNWVPASCFPATVDRKKYRHLVRLAKDAHYNMLRIWGGGIYEKDEFYDACDELGVMVWQDLMFACSDYPDDDPDFVNEVVKEFEYQVKRLRNRPCIVYWCGGNEKTGSAGFRVNYGERIFHVIGRGVCADLDPTREYRPASPHSFTDLGNDRTSGDSHGGCYEKAFVAGTLGWREKMRPYASVFNSEFGFHGPARYSSMVKFVPEDEIWPIGEAMNYHVQDNPYNSIPETFAEVQGKMAQILVGDINDGESFVRCASTFHGEMLRAEIEFHRRLKWTNGGAMFWMFNDCWPCASWSVVDYYLMPKPAYYASKRGFAPLHVAVVDEPKTYDVYIINDSLKPVAGRFEYGQGRVVAGKHVWSRKQQVKLDANSSKLVASIAKRQVRKDKNTYLFGTLTFTHKTLAQTQFFHNPWRETDWPDPQLSYRIGVPKKVAADHPVNGKSQYLTKITFKTVNYARTVNIDGVEGEGVLLSDNFFDLMPGESKTVEIRSDRKLRTKGIRIRHWRDKWD